MTIAAAKAISIVGFLDRLGFTAVRGKGRANEEWYLSPLRGEKTPSFKVDLDRNRWIDFGERSRTGDLIDFAQAYWGLATVSAALRKIAEVSGGAAVTPVSPGVHRARSRGKDDEPRLELLGRTDVRPGRLRDYLQGRGLDPARAGRYLGIATYRDRVTGRRRSGLCWGNIRGGIETRSPGGRIVIGPHGISVFTVAPPVRRGVALFEGVWDFLTYVQIGKPPLRAVAVVMNGTGLVAPAIEYVASRHDGEPLDAYLQNDRPGLVALAKLKHALPGIRVCNREYARYADLNDAINDVEQDAAAIEHALETISELEAVVEREPD